ncbi:MAG: hypothetical protein GY770_10040 [Aestuariibacter sp.]|nr:hypothetical protein [Aestuariibacter sp.]
MSQKMKMHRNRLAKKSPQHQFWSENSNSSATKPVFGLKTGILPPQYQVGSENLKLVKRFLILGVIVASFVCDPCHNFAIMFVRFRNIVKLSGHFHLRKFSFAIIFAMGLSYTQVSKLGYNLRILFVTRK